MAATLNTKPPALPPWLIYAVIAAVALSKVTMPPVNRKPNLKQN